MKDGLILGLIRKGMSLAEAEEVVAGMDPALFAAPAPAAPAAPVDPSAAIPMLQGVARLSGLPIPAINQHGLKEAQVQAALAAGYALCPNCQQPTHDHLPGCARADMPGSVGSDKRAITKDPLPPVG